MDIRYAYNKSHKVLYLHSEAKHPNNTPAELNYLLT